MEIIEASFICLTDANLRAFIYVGPVTMRHPMPRPLPLAKGYVDSRIKNVFCLYKPAPENPRCRVGPSKLYFRLSFSFGLMNGCKIRVICLEFVTAQSR